DLLLKVLELALSLPEAVIRAPSAPPWVWILYGLTVAAVVLAIHWRRTIVCVAGCALVIVLQIVIAIVDFSPRTPDEVTLTFLDVGQGDSVLIEFPSGSRMLVDGGGVAAGRFLDLRDESTFSIGENVLLPYLFSRRIRRLDTIVLTHAHHDHMDGLFSVLNN